MTRPISDQTRRYPAHRPQNVKVAMSAKVEKAKNS